MRQFVFLLLLVSLGVPTPDARGELAFSFYVTHRQEESLTGEQHRWHMLTYVDDPFFPDFTLASPDGAFTASGNAFEQDPRSATFNDFAALRTAASESGPWTLHLTTDLGTSHYRFVPDLLGIFTAELASSSFLSPAPDAGVGPRPEFRWTAPDGDVRGAILSVRTEDWSIQRQQGVLGETSFTFPVDLPARNYIGGLTLLGLQSKISVAAELISGPDLGPVTARLDFSFRTETRFTVVPEPLTSSTGMATMILLLVRNRRNSSSVRRST